MSAVSETGRSAAARLLPLSGAAFVVVTVVAIVAIGGDTPDSDASAAKVSSFYRAHQDRQTLAGFVLAASIPLIVLFGVTLASAIWRARPARRPIWPAVLFGGSLLTAGAFILAAFVHVALADAADDVSAQVAQGLNVLDADTWVAFNSCLGVLMLGAAGSLIPSSGGYRVLGWIALPVGIALFIPFADFFGLLLTGIWLIVTSVLLYRSEPAFA
jgi:hypothetical protein